MPAKAKVADPSVRNASRLSEGRKNIDISKLIEGFTAPAGRYGSVDAALRLGERLRRTFIQYPILPGALITYQQIASSREWVVTGKPEKASAAWDFLQNAQTLDPETGMVEYGFEQFLKRRSMDFNLIGRTAFASRRVSADGGKVPVLRYIDPVGLNFLRHNIKETVKDGIKPPSPTEQVWRYGNVSYALEDVMINHPIPLGTRSFVAPVFSLLPMANLVWLIREHDMAMLDGRKIRDIIMVSNASIGDSMEDAIYIQAALWGGESVEDTGLPIVEITNPTGGKVADMIHIMGISRLPEDLNREEVIFQYVNEISANLGLSLRHFWNNEKTTNKALEQVQEQRQQQKGPAAFVRTEQRLINNSGFLDRLDNGEVDEETGPTRFTFIEETDAAVMEMRADVLLKTSQALTQVATVFGASIAPEDFLAWMQSERILPYEMELTGEPAALVNQGSEAGNAGKGETTLDSDAAPLPMATKTPSAAASRSKEDTESKMKYGQVMINKDGLIVATRKKVFPVTNIKVLQAQLAEVTDDKVTKIVNEWVEEGDLLAYTKVSEAYVFNPNSIKTYLQSKSAKVREEIEEAIDLVVSNIELDTKQAELIDDLAVYLWDEDDEEETDE